MAEGWTKALKDEIFECYSAGTKPQPINPLAVKVMGEAGVDIRQQTSKHLEDFTDWPFDFVVTVCDSVNEICPVFTGNARKIHAGFDDPPKLAEDARSEEEALVHYRRIRDEIRAYIETLPENLGN